MANKLVKKSMTYERVLSRLNSMAIDLQNEINTTPKPEPTDYSRELVVMMLRAMAKACEGYSNKIWVIAEKRAIPSQDALDNLANAIVMMSVSDYEKMVSGRMENNAEHSMDEILDFWENRSAEFTQLDMTAVRTSIDSASRKFKQIVKEHGGDIVEETIQGRKNKRFPKSDLRYHLSYECPLCKGKLYAHKWRNNKTYTIQCTGCDLSSTWCA